LLYLRPAGGGGGGGPVPQRHANLQATGVKSIAASMNKEDLEGI
jgi:hypothetical protein